MRTLRAAILACVAIAAVPVCLAALTDEVAEIKYLDGPVTIIRNGKALPAKEVDFGTALENFDQIKTGPKGTVELQTRPSTGISAVITVRPNTTMRLDITSLKSSQAGGVELLAGAVALKVDKMAGQNKLDVRTGTATMGVRGTQFVVDVAQSGDVLLTTSEGRVECSAGGKSLYSDPGRVVQGTLDGEWTQIPVAVDGIEAFRAKWHTERIGAFKANPDRATGQFAKRYKDLKTRFDAAYAELFANRDVVRLWIEQDKAGNVGDGQATLVEMKKVLPALVKLRKVNVQFERVYLRLMQLEELYASEKLATKGQLKDLKMTTGQFFTQFRNDRSLLEQKFLDIQYMTKLYAKRNGGEFPLDLGSGDEFADTEDFFLQ